MLRPGGSSLSLRAIGSSLRNLNNISTDKLDEKILFLMPSVVYHRGEHTERLHHSGYYSEFSSRNHIASNMNLNKVDNELSIPVTKESNSIINQPTSIIITDADDLQIPKQIHTQDYQNLTQTYFKRWIILFVFCLISLLNAFNWIEYGIIQDVVIVFYNQSLPEDPAAQYDAVNWFSMVYMLCYIPLVFPAMFLLERKGLRLSCILGALLTTIGAIIKCTAVNPDLFAVAMLGQTICAIAQSFTLGIPARLSALWFGPNEIGLATSIGVFGNQLGTAIGFLIPSNVVIKSESIKFIEKRFYYLLVPVAVLCLLSFILAVIVVKDQPDKPPSLAQLEIRRNYDSIESKEVQESDLKLFKSSLINLFKNFNFCLILISYGINTGTYYSISTLLNQIISQYHENENEKIGIIGLILVLSGLVGAVVGGIVLDKTKKFKLITFTIYACSFGAMVLFTFTLSINIWLIFATSFLLGFFMTGYLPVGFELAAEVTYPASEGTSCGLLNTSAQVFGIFYTYVQGRITTVYGALAGNLFVSGSLLIGTIITGFVRSDLRRQSALKQISERVHEKVDNLDSSVNRSDENNNTVTDNAT